MFKRVVALLVVLAFLVAPVAAVDGYEWYHLYEETGVEDVLGYRGNSGGAYTYSEKIDRFGFTRTQLVTSLSRISVETSLSNVKSWNGAAQSGSAPFSVSNGNAGGGGTYVWYVSGDTFYQDFYFDSWTPGTLTGSKYFPISTSGALITCVKAGDSGSFSSGVVGSIRGSMYWASFSTTTLYTVSDWCNEVFITTVDDGLYNISVDRTHAGYSGESTISLYESDVAIELNSDSSDWSRLVSGGSYRLDIFSPLSMEHYVSYHELPGETVYGHPVTIWIYDADTRLPLSGDWHYYVVVTGSDAVTGDVSGTNATMFLPVTSILQPHLLRVTKEGYEQTSPLAFDVPVGGREVNVYLTPLDTTAPEGSSVVTFIVTDIETGTPRGSCLVNVDGVGKYAGASGSVWFVLPENSTHQWLVTAEGYWPIGGDFTLGVDDLVIPVGMTKKTSELPRPPMPGIPGLPVIHPSLDPAGFRMQILSVPILGDLASPLLDTVDRLGVGLDDIAIAVLDVLTAPADQITGAVSSVSQNLIDTATPYLATSSLLLQVIGAAVSCLPAQVTGLVTFGLLLDIVRILLWGPA